MKIKYYIDKKSKTLTVYVLKDHTKELNSLLKTKLLSEMKKMSKSNINVIIIERNTTKSKSHYEMDSKNKAACA